MKKNQPNWVERRAACHADTVFEQLCERVKADVEEIQKLPADKRGGYDFFIPDDNTTWMLRMEARPPGGGMETVICFQRHKHSFQQQPDSITIETLFPPQRSEKVKLTLRWNPRRLSCALFFSGEERAVEIWEVSQQVLGALLPNP